MNAQVALQLARALGVEWLLHIDADEMFFAGGGEGSGGRWGMRWVSEWRPSVSDVSAAAAVTRQHFRALSEAEGGDYAQAIYLNHEVR